jgi:acyl carrier protein
MSSTRPSRWPDPNDIAGALTTFINTTIMSRGRPVQPDDDLEAAGLDSMALLKVLIFIEAEFGFWMPDEDLVTENIASPCALANYICRRFGTSSA